MKVFKIVTGQPVGSRHKEFASLDCKRTDSKVFRSLGSGRPASSWRPMQLHVFDPGKPKPDFFGLGLDHICNPRAHDLVSRILKQSGELLPLTVKGLEGTHYLYNCTTVIDALDPDRSVWEFFKETGTTHIEIPSFHAKRLVKATLFKYPKAGLSRVYVVERSGDHRDGEFKALVEHHGITGLRFDLLWSDKDGPVPPKHIWDEGDPAEYRTADGKRLVHERSGWVTKPPSITKPAAPEREVEKPKEPKPKHSQPKREKVDREPPRRVRTGIRILQVQAVKPTRIGKRKPAPCLSCKASDREFLAAERFRGHPFPEDWRKVELNFGKEKPWKADLYVFGPGALVCSEQAMDTLAPLEDEGEFLPVKIKGIRGKYFLYNSTNCTSYLDEKDTAWKKPVVGGTPSQISKYAFRAQRIGEDCLFKLLDEGAVNLYCIDRTGDRYDHECKALVESEGLTGLAFNQVWSGGR